MTFDPLVTTDWLAEHLDEVRIVDIRGYVKRTDLGDDRRGPEARARRLHPETAPRMAEGGRGGARRDRARRHRK